MCCGCCFDEERPEGGLGTGLSWDPSNVDKEVGEAGCCNGKFTMYMVFQVLLAIAYAVFYGFSFAATNAYYEWPMNKIENTSLWEPRTWDLYTGEINTSFVEVYLSAIIEENQSFVCGNRTFYRNGTGPILNVSSVISEDLWIRYNGGEKMGTVVVCYLMMCFFALLVIFGLTSGRYNRLLMVVKFEEGEDGKIQPKKLSFVWTIMCNAKTIYNVSFKEMCGRMAEFAIDNNQAKNNGEEYVSGDEVAMRMAFLAGWFSIVAWILLSLVSCSAVWPEHCSEQFEDCARWTFFRVVVAYTVIVTYAIWLTHFDPPTEFNPETPWLCVINVVAWSDLAVSTLYDIYDACNKFCIRGTPDSAAYAEKGTESSAADTGTETAPAPDSEEGLPLPETAPPRQSVPVKGLPSNKRNGHHGAVAKGFPGGQKYVPTETAPDTEEDLPLPGMAPPRQSAPVGGLPSNKRNGAVAKEFPVGQTDPKYPLNACVELVGLSSGTDNGKYGVIVGQRNGRIVVRLLDENRTLGVKKEKVSVVEVCY